MLEDSGMHTIERTGRDAQNDGSRIVFREVGFRLSDLLTYIRTGDLGLPDIQRPFVWNATKVRDLFDSMYRGFPVGYLLLWDNIGQNGTRQIGIGGKTHTVPRFLVIDGQQRLTSLYAVFEGKAVIDKDYEEKHIEIAFCPRDGRFEVADAAIRKDPEFIPDISSLWTMHRSSRKAINEFVDNLKAKRPLSEDEERLIEQNIDRVHDIIEFPFTALEISSVVDEEQVADIFVRVNSEGVKLNQANFILTLMSVYWDEGRAELERFAREARAPPKQSGTPSPFNHFIQPSPEHLLRVAIAMGFWRGRLKSVYQVLRGKDLDTGVFSVEKRDEQFGKLKEAQERVLDLTYWHQFFGALKGAGFVGKDLISSDNTLLYAYAFYLIGKTHYKVEDHQLDLLIGRWFYASSLSGRYTSSPETAMDGDMNRVKGLKDAESFVATLEKIIQDTFTSDFWSITLPNSLESSASVSPALFAYHAAQMKLGAPVLFSHKTIAETIDPSLRLKKKYIDKHHLFPRGWLEKQGIDNTKKVNQLANFALLEWPDNIRISDTAPAEYLPKLRQRFDEGAWTAMCEMHALPPGWEQMDYEDFLRQRRLLMAQVIRKGFEKLR